MNDESTKRAQEIFDQRMKEHIPGVTGIKAADQAMFDALDQYEAAFGKIGPFEKAVFFFAYSKARVDALIEGERNGNR